MPVITGARSYVDVPAPEPKTGGVLATVRVIDVADPHALLGAEYQTDACYAVSEWLSNCGNYPDSICDPPVVPGTWDVKDFHGLKMVTGDPFSLYDGIECSTPGHSHTEEEGRVTASLALKESRGVEERLSVIFAAWSGAYTIGVSGIVNGVAAMEKWLEENYAGQGFISMTREMATRAVAADVVAVGIDGRLATVTGTPVVLGIGDSDTIFASGQITVLRGPVMVNSVPAMNLGTGECAPARVLAERTYVPLVECGVAIANITTP